MTHPKVDVYLETGTKRVFAGALAWPGWCRSGKDEEAALAALIAYAPRFATAMRGARPALRPPGVTATPIVGERLRGDATTDFGAPSVAPSTDAEPISDGELRRLSSIMRRAWAALDRADEAAHGVALAKGPRGGGRELDAIIGHVVNSEAAYLRRIAGSPPKFSGTDPRARLKEERTAVLDGLARGVTEGLPPTGPRGGAIWLPRYFVRRAAWHVLDHAWEIEDRSSR